MGVGCVILVGPDREPSLCHLGLFHVGHRLGTYIQGGIEWKVAVRREAGIIHASNALAESAIETRRKSNHTELTEAELRLGMRKLAKCFRFSEEEDYLCVDGTGCATRH